MVVAVGLLLGVSSQKLRALGNNNNGKEVDYYFNSSDNDIINPKPNRLLLLHQEEYINNDFDFNGSDDEVIK